MTQLNKIPLCLFSKMALGDGIALMYQPQADLTNGMPVAGDSFLLPLDH